MSSADSQIHHIAFILDGNRRWAEERGLPKLEGHKAGYERLKEIALATFDRDISYFSAYVFSTENWKRSKSEVKYLMDLVLWGIERDLQELHSKGVKVVVTGFRDKVSPRLLKAIDRATELTKDNTEGVMNLCFNYGGQQEIIEGVRKLIEQGVKPKDVTEQSLKASLVSAEIPAPDLIVRTSGEQRLSNFLLWDSAYSELIFVPINWPDFDKPWLDKVIADYSKRDRRFGGA